MSTEFRREQRDRILSNDICSICSISATVSSGSTRWGTVFGSIIVDCQLYINSIFVWKLKLHENKEENGEYFTLSIIDHEYVTENSIKDDHCRNYGLFTNTPNSLSDLQCQSETRKLDIFVGRSDIYSQKLLKRSSKNQLKVEFNVKERTNKFFGNDTEYMKQFKNVDITKKYRFGMAIMNSGTTMKITDFEIEYAP